MGRKMINIYIYIYMFGWREDWGKAWDGYGRKEKKNTLFFWREMERGKGKYRVLHGPTFSFPPKLEGNREERICTRAWGFFFLSFLPCKPNTLNARYSHFLFLLFVSTLDFFFFPPSIFSNIKSLTPCKINVLKLLT